MSYYFFNVICICLRKVNQLWCLPHIVLCFSFVFLRLVYPKLPVSLDCPALIAPSVLSNAFFKIAIKTL